MSEMDGIWILPALVVALLLMGAFYLGKEVGKDYSVIRQAFSDGRELGHEETLDALMRAPGSIYDEVAEDLRKGIWRCKCHRSPFSDRDDRDAHEAFIDSIGGPEQETRWTEAPW